jgi:hypothetical protein
MSYNFTGAEYNRFTGGTFSTQPTEYTLAAWVKPADVTARGIMVRSNGAPLS